ncbi:MAG: ferritin family protein [Anaerolineae bacterium]|nr:ferritin family protein [Anaerolineae bacterium]
MAFMKAADIAELAMELEKNGEAFYRAVASKAGMENLRALFEDLADQEVQHYKVFQKLSQSIKAQPLMTDQEWDMYQDYLSATIQSAFFEGTDKALAAAEMARTEQDALRMAIGFEKETVFFFLELLDVVPESAKETIDKVIAEEQRHVRRLARLV